METMSLLISLFTAAGIGGLKTELLNTIVYSIDEVLKDFSTFNQSPTKENFVIVASSIHKDLWDKDSQLSHDVESILKSIQQGDTARTPKPLPGNIGTA